MKPNENRGRPTDFLTPEGPARFWDTDTVSTFHSKTSATSYNQGATTDLRPPNHVSIESVQHSQEPEISGLTEDPRIEILEKKFDLVTTNFNATLHQITAQQEVREANFQQLFSLLSKANLGQNLGSSTVNEPPGNMSSTPHAKDNQPSVMDQAGGLRVTGQGS
jgi:hypothetical protein